MNPLRNQPTRRRSTSTSQRLGHPRDFRRPCPSVLIHATVPTYCHRQSGMIPLCLSTQQLRLRQWRVQPQLRRSCSGCKCAWRPCTLIRKRIGTYLLHSHSHRPTHRPTHRTTIHSTHRLTIRPTRLMGQRNKECQTTLRPSSPRRSFIDRRPPCNVWSSSQTKRRGPQEAMQAGRHCHRPRRCHHRLGRCSMWHHHSKK